MFEDTLSKMAAIAVLMTIVPSMGGVAGNQTVALVIRGLAVGHIGDSNTRWLLSKEARVGLINGLLWALIISGVVGPVERQSDSRSHYCRCNAYQSFRGRCCWCGYSNHA